MPRKLFTSSSARVRLGRASREAESPSGGHGQSTSSRGYLMSKGNWNKSSERFRVEKMGGVLRPPFKCRVPNDPKKWLKASIIKRFGVFLQSRLIDYWDINIDSRDFKKISVMRYFALF